MKGVSVAQLDARLDPRRHAPDTICKFSVEILVGHLARGQFLSTIAYGRSIGLEVDAYKGGADLAQRYWAVRARGRLVDMRRFVLALEMLG